MFGYIHIYIFLTVAMLCFELGIEGSEDPQIQPVCVLPLESNHRFVLCFTFFILYSVIYSSFMYNHLSFVLLFHLII